MFVVVTSATSDNPNPTEWPTAKVRSTGEVESGISVWEFPLLSDAIAFAVEHCAEWIASNILALMENMSDASDKDEAKHWHEQAVYALAEMSETLRMIARLDPNDPQNNTYTHISCPGDWVRVELAGMGDA